MFNPVEPTTNFPKQELAVGQFWKENRIYEKSLEQRADAPPFVFYEGPPTANGMPHPGHCLTRAIKDLFPRYRTMRGYRCERKAGWDTHGLPVEVEVCKELGIHSKEEIENYGIEPFIQKCQQSVWRYMKEWERMTDRIGFWVDLKNAYATYHQSFVESVWWSLKELYDRGLLYQGHKIVWWWAQGGTALSSGEVGEGYRSVADPSVFVKFPVIDDDGDATGESLLVWTTTPWTLPSNQFVAVNPDIPYTTVFNEETKESLYVAVNLAPRIVELSKGAFRLTASTPILGHSLVRLRYQPPFDCFKKLDDSIGEVSSTRGGGTLHRNWRVIVGDFVAVESGTGLVHIAPAFGEDDHQMLSFEQQDFADGQGPKLINCVAPDGKFTGEAPEYCRGRWVKDCDKDIVRDLKQRGLLFHQEQYVHDYPFCPRAEQDALIQYPRQSWFIRTSQFKDDMLANNAKINWLPEHIKDGRFGKFLETNVDWALSRERYWGTPLPIWKCQATGKMEAVGSYDELVSKPGVTGGEVWDKAKQLNPHLPDDLRIHKPYIDEIVYDSPFEKGAHMRRVPEVIDCWYDAGSMPFAQWGYPHAKNSDAHFKSQFPADFISEAIDQTRGWFYAQLAISTLMFGTCSIAGTEQRGKASDTESLENALEFFIKKGYSREKAMREVADMHGYEFFDPRDLSIPKPIFELVPESVAREHAVIPLAEEGSSLKVLVSDPFAYETFEKVQFLLNRKINVALAMRESIVDAINRHYGKTGGDVAVAISPNSGAQLPAPNSQLHAPYPHPFRNCIVLGHMLGEDGLKMSKRKRNYLPPDEIFDRYGADALRWYFFANQPPWTSIRYNEQSIKDSIPEFLLRLWNVYSFFVIYANIDGFDPAQELGEPASAGGLPTFSSAKSYRPIANRSELDRWILSELNRTCAAVVERMDAYDNYAACGHITAFVDALSNWYVRRSRDRFWAADKRGQEKLDAYWTLYEALVTTTKLVAPFVPFLAETLWQNVTSVFKTRPESVHLTDFPTGDASAVDEALSARMNLVRLISSLGRNARSAASLKVRQPLAKVEVILADTTHQAWLEEHAAVIEEELNVKQLEFCDDPSLYVEHEVVPNFKLLGPKLGKLLPKVKQWLGQQTGAQLLENIRDNGQIDLTIDGQAIALTREEVEVRIKPRPGWTSANDQGVVVVLATELTQELLDEGVANDVIRLIQDRRKDTGCEYTDRIEVGLVTESADVRRAIEQFRNHIAQETLASKLQFEPLPGVTAFDSKVGDAALQLFVRAISHPEGT